MTKSLHYKLQFIFDDSLETPLLKVDVSWEGKSLNLSLSELSMFLHSHEDSLPEEDVDFCFSLGRVLKKVRLRNDLIIAIPHVMDMALFFQRAKELKRTLYWAHEGELLPLTYSRKVPYTIMVKSKQKQLTCELKDRALFAYHALRWFPIEVEKTSFVFANGTLVESPSESLEYMVSELLENEKMVFKGDETTRFFHEFYEPNKQTIQWELPSNLKEFLPQDVRPVPYLDLTYTEPQLMPKLSFMYADEIIDSMFEDPVVLCKKTGKKYQRKMKLEQKAQMELISLFEEYDVPLLLTNPGDIAKFMGEIIPRLVDRGWTVNSNVPKFQILDDPVKIEFGIESSGKDWFSFESSTQINGQNVSLQEVARLMVDQGGYIPTKKGYVRLHPDSEKEIKMLAELGAFKVQQKFSKAAIVPLISAAKVKGSNDEIKSIIESVKSFNKTLYCDVSENFKGELRPYQQYGVNWMNFLHKGGFGGVLADDMGLGKTVQVIAFLSQLDRNSPVMVIAPTNVLYNWEKEIKSFCPSLTTLVYTGASRHKKKEDLAYYDVIICSFGIVKNDNETLTPITFSGIVVDEAQYIKNSNTQISQAIKALNSPYRLALTGTPIENKLEDIWNLFDFVMPDYLGSQKTFDLLMKDGQRQQLKSKIKPFVLRREKKEVLDSLPDKVEINITCPLSESQKALYETVLSTIKKGLKSSTGQIQRMNILKALLKLRQICISPALLEECKSQTFESSKMDVLKDRLPLLIEEGHKVVCFSQFTGVLDLMEDWISETGIYTERIDGSVSAKKRLEAVDRFQESEKPGIFLISLKAGGVGLNLTSASYVFLLDPWWNPAIESQAMDRVHRMGQTNKVFVYRLVAKGTIEEKIQDLQNEKKSLLAEIVDIDSAVEKAIDFNEISNLILS